jgi:hypothetical protein
MKILTKNFHVYLLVVLTMILALPSLVSGINGEDVFLHTGHDVLWHMSVAAEVKRGLPLMYPAMDGVKLTNYHYFTDLAVGALNLILNIPLFTVYYRILPLALIGLLIFRIYKLSFLITKNKFASTLATISALTAGSSAFLLPLLINKNDWQGGAFMLDPIYTQLVNPHGVLGLALLFWGIYHTLVSIKTANEKDCLKHLYFAFLLFSVLFAVKIFYALPALFALFSINLFYIFKRGSRYIIPPALAVLTVLLITLSISDGNSLGSVIEFRPMWLLIKMAEQDNRFPLPDLMLKRAHYIYTNNIFRIFQQDLKLLLIFFLGNFWIKLLGIYFLIRSFWQMELKIFLLVLITTSIFLTLFFVPNPDNFNAVQFGHVAVVLSGWLFGLFVALNFNKLTAVGLVILVSTTFWLEFPEYAKTSGVTLTKSEYDALEFIRKQTPVGSVFLVDSGRGNEVAFVSGLGERRTYFDDYKTTQLLGIDYQDRSDMQNMFFNGYMNNSDMAKFLTVSNIKYIFVYEPNEQIKNYVPLESIYSNDKVSLYVFDRDKIENNEGS